MNPAPLLPTPWQRLPVELSEAMLPDLPATVRTVSGAVAEAAPAFASITDAKFERDVRAAARVALERFIELVGTDAAALPPRLREFFVALGAAEARENRGPDAVLAAYRTAGRCLLRAASEALATVRPLDPDVLIDLFDRVTAFVDELAAASTDGFARQVQEQAGEGDRRRRLAELLLRGGAPETVVATTAAGIGWSGFTTVVPIVVPLDHARDARFRFGADGVLLERPRDAVLLVRLPYHLSSLTQAAARAAVGQAPALLSTVDAIKRQRDRIVDELRKDGLTVADSDANFVLFGRFDDQSAVWHALLDRGVLVRDVGLAGWLRVTAGTPEETDAFLRAIREVL
ncbi:hypothetical protein GCM10009557_37340 [Virgisporangium ochraceum]